MIDKNERFHGFFGCLLSYMYGFFNFDVLDFFCHLINENTVIRLFLSSAVIKKQYERICWIFYLSRWII